MSQGTWWSADWWAGGWAAKGELGSAPGPGYLPVFPLHCVGRWKECPRGFLPQNQLMTSQLDVVRWIWLPMIKLKEFQWACKFENKETSNQFWRADGERRSFFLMSPEFGMHWRNGTMPHQLGSRIAGHCSVARPLDLHHNNVLTLYSVQFCPSCQLLLCEEKLFSCVYQPQAQSWQPNLLNGMLEAGRWKVPLCVPQPMLSPTTPDTGATAERS